MDHRCDHCNRSFSSKSSLKRHVKNIHLPSKDRLIKNFICYHCSKNYPYKTSLIKHLVSCKSHKKIKQNPKIISCCLCDATKSSKLDILQHYNLAHGLDMSIKELNFNSYVEFDHWKDKLESDTVSRYTRLKKSKNQSNTIYYYHCHRDGFFNSRGKNIKRLKSLGSNRINGHCPANMRVRSSLETGKISVRFLPTHVGHGSSDLRRIPLKKSERDFLASKIQQKIPFDDILSQVRETADENNFGRIHLLTRKDLFNIKREYNIDNSVRYANDATSLEAWINQSYEKNGTSVVRFYKKQGEVKEDCSYTFEKNDFLLIIMNETQLEVLKKYGNGCICIDSTHGLNSYDIELTTLMVLDDLRQGFPCMFAFSNRPDTQIFKIMFDILKTHLNKETLSPNVFMSDMGNAFYNAWCEVIGTVDMRLYYSWHVNKAWKKNVLAMVKDSKQQEAVYKILQTLLKERDKEAFEQMLQESLNQFKSNAEWKSFGEYFRENYVENRTAWAYCYRQHLGPNANMHIKRMHRTLKDIYLKGKYVSQLDKAINDIMKMVRDKLYERLIILDNGKISKKISDLRHRHKTAIQIPIDDSLILTNEDGTWTIPSSQANEFDKIEVLNPSCVCSLKCKDCDACLHAYICSCADSAVEWNMCKHIHTICMYLKRKAFGLNVNMNRRIHQNMMEDDDLDNSFLIDEDPKTADQNVILNHLSGPTQLISEVDKRKEKIRETFELHLNSATTTEHLTVIENALLSIGPACLGIESNACKTKKKIKQQRLNS